MWKGDKNFWQHQNCNDSIAHLDYNQLHTSDVTYDFDEISRLMDDAAAVNLETKKFNFKKMQQKYHIQAQAEYKYYILE